MFQKDNEKDQEGIHNEKMTAVTQAPDMLFGLMD